MLVVKVVVTLQGSGLCAAIEERAAYDDLCASTSAALQGLHNLTSTLALYTVTWEIREPRSTCKTVAVFYSAVLSFLMPAALLYMLERSQRRAFLLARGHRPDGWLALAAVCTPIRVAVAMVCMLSVYPVLTVLL